MGQSVELFSGLHIVFFFGGFFLAVMASILKALVSFLVGFFNGEQGKGEANKLMKQTRMDNDV